MDKSSSKLETESIPKLLVQMSLPMMISMLINSLYNIIDSIYVSRLGTQAVTALSIIFPLQNLTIAVSVGLGVGVNSLIARRMGAGELEGAEQAASDGMGLAIAHAVIFFLIGVFAIEPYVGFYTSGQTYQWSVDYGQIVLCFSLPYLLFLVIEKIFQSIGWMKTTMFVMATGAIINIILDPVLIFGYFGLPALGVSGAAIATVTGQFCAFVIFTLIYFFSDFPIRLRAKYIFPRAHDSVAIYAVALPAALTLGLPSVLVGVLNTILIRYSEVSVAVLGLYYKIQTFFYMPVSGLVQGMRPLVGYNYGAKRFERVRETERYSFIIATVILAIGTLLLLVFPAQIMDLFDPDPDLKTAGITALRIIAIGFIPSAVAVICNGLFEAFGLGLDSLLISVSRQIVFMIPIAYLLSSIFGADGVYAAFPVSEVLAACLSFILLKRAYSRIGGIT